MTSLAVGTVTYAAKGKDILARNGIKSSIKRIQKASASLGCGYALVIEGNASSATRILNQAGIRILEVRVI